jgi:8-oxo-dGTP diphosphatase
VEVQWRRAAAYVACRDAGGRLLLTRFALEGHPDTGRWTMPGGGMEWGESPEATASRELLEETGLEGTIGAVLGVFSHWFTAQESARGEAGHVLGVVYDGVDVEGELRTEWADSTTDAAAWFTLDEIRALPTVPLVDFVLGLLA